MATLRLPSRPAPPPAGARADRRTWVAVPLGLGALIALSLLLRTAELGIGFWIDEGLSVGIADRPLGGHPGRAAQGRLAAAVLHAAALLARRSRATARRACACFSLLFALLAIPVAWWAGRRSGARRRRRWFAAVLMAFNPFLAQYAQEARMYSMVALLAIPATACFLRAYALDTDEPAPVDRGLRGLGRGRALHAQLADLLRARRPASRGSCCWRSATAAPQELFRDGLLGFGGAARAVPAVGADDALPGRAHRRAVGRRARARARCSASPACCSAGCRRSCC